MKRIVKAKLAQLEDHPADGTKKEFQLNKARLGRKRLCNQPEPYLLLLITRQGCAQDALLAFAESAKVFINYITAAANDACKEAKRQTMSEADVLAALEELQFEELIPELKRSLDGGASCAICSCWLAFHL